MSLPSAEKRAIASSLLAAALFAAMALGVRSLSGRIPGPQIASVRFATGLVVVALVGLFGRVDLRPRRWGWLTSRGIAGGLAVVAYFACIEHVGVGVATLLNHTGPVWSLIFAWVLLGEIPRPRALLALALTMVGVVLVVGRSAGWSAPGSAGGAAGWHIGWWDAVGVFSAVTTGIAVTSIRAVRRPRSDGQAIEGSWTVFFSFTALGLASTLPWVLGRWVAPTAREWAVLLAAALTSIAAQLAMTAALAHVTAVASGIILQLTVVLSLLGGMVLFDEALGPQAALGALLTMAGVVWMVLAAAPAAVPGDGDGARPPAQRPAR
jgi:drug/metabolite transporter (DMT)-like permease